MKKCEKCQTSKEDVTFYSDKDGELPEDAESGYYCEECVKKLKNDWWEIEKSAYCDGNCDDCEDFDCENDKCLRDII
ncbi:MAG: hypothetical protein PHY73_08810 [Candidatus Omnitrophica bacterium]|nr:hypothetical protein [Candidatus Omnitrophota bacterium]